MGDPSIADDHDDRDDTTPGQPAGSGRSGSGLLNGRMMAAVAAVAVGIVAAVVIVSITGSDDDESAEASEAVEITAVPGSAEPTTDPTTASPSEPSTDALEVTNQGDFEVSVSRGDPALFEITVHDPETPTSAGSPPQHCVVVTMMGPTSVETHGCAAVEDTTAPGSVTLQLSTPGDPLIGCASVLTRDASGDLDAADATTTFAVSEGAELPAGNYEVTLTTITGVGDGCEPADEPLERSTMSTFEITLD